MNVSITGASGFIGKALCDAFVSGGHGLLVLSRRRLEEVGAAAIQGDLSKDTESLDAFVSDCDVLCHCAGEIKKQDLMYNLHVKGTSNLLAAVKRRILRTGQPLHWVQLSSTGAYGGQAQDRLVDESFSPAPVGAYEVTKTIADELVMSFAKCEPLFSYTIIRPSVVIGRDMPNQSVFQLARMVRKQLFFYVGDRFSNVSTYVHVDDVARAMVCCAEDKRAVNQTFILSNDCPQVAVIDAFARHGGVAAPRWQLPESLVRTAIEMTPAFLKLPLTPQRLDALTIKGGYSSQSIKNRLGFDFRASIPECVSALLANQLDG